MLDNLDQLGNKDPLVHPDHKDSKDPRDNLVLLGPQVNQDQQGLQVLQDH